MEALNYGNEALADTLINKGATLIGTPREVRILKAFNSFANNWLKVTPAFAAIPYNFECYIYDSFNMHTEK